MSISSTEPWLKHTKISNSGSNENCVTSSRCYLKTGPRTSFWESLHHYAMALSLLTVL